MENDVKHYKKETLPALTHNEAVCSLRWLLRKAEKYGVLVEAKDRTAVAMAIKALASDIDVSPGNDSDRTRNKEECYEED